MEKTVLFEKTGGVALITLNRPERRNALNQDLLANLYSCIDEVAADDGIRAAVITGAGTAFCSGLDLKAIATDNLIDPRGDGRGLSDVLGGCEKPIIGAVNGPAMTGGFELALNCDFLIASDNASFADTHVKMGIHPGVGHEPAPSAGGGPAHGQADVAHLPVHIRGGGAAGRPGERGRAG